MDLQFSKYFMLFAPFGVLFTCYVHIISGYVHNFNMQNKQKVMYIIVKV
nr:MAG TPA: hypothetical protein [Caudoviricetes sp.]